MDATVEAFRKRLGKPWIVGVESEDILDAFDKACLKLAQSRRPVVVSLVNSQAFLMHALATLALHRPLILGTSNWPSAAFPDGLPAADVCGEIAWPKTAKGELAEGSIAIATGGSGGRLRFALHDWCSISAAVKGYCGFWGLRKIHCLNILPLHHVGGFIPAMRTFLTGGQLLLADWKQLEAGELPQLPSPKAHLSIVPTQLKRLLDQELSRKWLRRFSLVLVGGGACPPALIEGALSAGIRLGLAYGMTEAAGTVAVLKPDVLTTQHATSGELLPHWEAKIENREIQIAGEALFRGYLPGEPRRGAWYATGDIGQLFNKKELKVEGRLDRMINTGGEKVNPFYVQQVLLDTELCRDAVVLGLPDDEWGQCIVAILQGQPVAEMMLMAHLTEKLPSYAIPKSFIWLDELPRNPLGKVDQQSLEALASELS